MPRKMPIQGREAEICTRLRAFRKSIGLFRITFALRAGLDSSTISRCEHLVAPLRFSVFQRLTSAYQLNATWLAVGGDRPMTLPGNLDFQEFQIPDHELFSKVYD